jgi:ribosomal-protein-serine acetyltransferase
MDGCSIRLYEPEDAEHLFTAARESAADISPWMGWCHPQYGLEDARRWIAEQSDLARKGAAYAFSVWREGRYVGGCGLNQINTAHRFANLGYWVRSSATGRGVAPAAVRLVAAFAFASTDLLRLEIVCAVGNVRSQRVAEKAGAVREGRLRNRLVIPSGPTDAFLYSLVRPAGGPSAS